jgi:hypothetical protein
MGTGRLFDLWLSLMSFGLLLVSTGQSRDRAFGSRCRRLANRWAKRVDFGRRRVAQLFRTVFSTPVPQQTSNQSLYSH